MLIWITCSVHFGNRVVVPSSSRTESNTILPPSQPLSNRIGKDEPEYILLEFVFYRNYESVTISKFTVIRLAPSSVISIGVPTLTGSDARSEFSILAS